MPLYQAIVLAVVQGVTEFLPVSSSAHLIIVPWLLGWQEPGLAFDAALHMGTLVAVVLYFLRDWIALVLAGIGLRYPRHASEMEVRRNRKIFWFLVVGTIPGAVAGYFGEKYIESTLRGTYVIAAMMFAVGLLMWLADATASLSKSMEKVSLPDSTIVGTAQAFALIPGVSRSGITIIAGLWCGLTREAAARFSFLLATPLIAGAATLKLHELVKLRHAGAMELSLSTLFLSIAVAGVVGWLVIALFLRYLQTRTLKIFVYYRLFFAIVIFLLTFLHLGAAR